MPIPDVIQPNIIQISQDLRLRTYAGETRILLPWYQDAETAYHLFHTKSPCTPEKLEQLFSLYQESSEVYLVELRDGRSFIPIGCVAFSQWGMPIVIAPSYRNRGLGRQVIQALIERGKKLRYDELMLQKIHDDNPAALKCYIAGGFKIYAITADSNLLHVLL